MLEVSQQKEITFLEDSKAVVLLLFLHLLLLLKDLRESQGLALMILLEILEILEPIYHLNILPEVGLDLDFRKDKLKI